MLTKIILLTAFAAEIPEPPEWMKGGKLYLTLKNGHVVHYPIEKWKIVPRIKEKPPAPIIEEKIVEVVVEKEVEKPVYKSNEISLFVGTGPDGLIIDEQGTGFEIREDGRVVVGLSYSRRLDENLSLKLQGQSNRTVLGGVGVSF